MMTMIGSSLEPNEYFWWNLQIISLINT